MINKTAIVIISYNRPSSLKRLLSFIDAADYSNNKNIPLVISIDGGSDANNQIFEIAYSFQWNFGEKKIIRHNKNLGLKKHVISCGDLSNEYGNVVVLEDDLIVSRSFYQFSVSALDYYKNDDTIAGISLYSYRFNENIYAPFEPLQNGFDTLFMQIPSSWGQVWSQKHWNGFKFFLEKDIEISQFDRLPENVKNWSSQSWKKIFYHYIVKKNLYFVYPYQSFSSNFTEYGTHFNIANSFFQVPLIPVWAKDKFEFAPLNGSSIKYDAYFEVNPSTFNFSNYNNSLVIDLYGTKQKELFIDNAYWLTIKKTSKSIKSYGYLLLPAFNNFLYAIEGNVFHLTKTDYLVREDGFDFKKDWMKNSQPYTFAFAEASVKYTKEYRVGNLILHPILIFKKLNRQFIRVFNRD